jgi:hypothetical protein
MVGLVTMPFIVRGLGTERFGLLSLAWVILGYFAVFDLGLGRATTKFVAEALGKGEADRVPGLVWTTVATQALLGAAGGLTLAAVTPLLVERALNVPPYLVREASSAFYVLAVGVPVTLISGSFVGVLDGQGGALRPARGKPHQGPNKRVPPGLPQPGAFENPAPGLPRLHRRGGNTALIVNFPTELYNYESPDEYRLPYNDPASRIRGKLDTGERSWPCCRPFACWPRRGTLVTEQRQKPLL